MWSNKKDNNEFYLPEYFRVSDYIWIIVDKVINFGLWLVQQSHTFC